MTITKLTKAGLNDLKHYLIHKMNSGNGIRIVKCQIVKRNDGLHARVLWQTRAWNQKFLIRKINEGWIIPPSEVPVRKSEVLKMFSQKEN